MSESIKKRNGNSITHEQFLTKIYKLVGKEYTVLTTYTSSKEKILMKHNICGREFWVRASHFTSSGSRCKVCSFKNMNAKTHEQFIKDIYSTVGEEYSVLGNYERAHIKVLIRHNTCGLEYLVDPASFLFGSRCPECNRKVIGDLKRKSHIEFLKECKHLVGEEYTVLSEYIATNVHVLMRHNNCGNEFTVMPSNFLGGKGCPKCKGKRISMAKTKTHDEFVERVFQLVGNEYKVIGSYEKARKKILMQHTICGHTYQVTPSHFVTGTRCPYCNESKGERIIKEYLESQNICFKREYTFPDCKNIDLLKFDFAIFDKNNSLLALIEFDGEQHFKPVPYFGGKKKYEETKKRDKIKNDYCQNNDLKLIRIPYYEEDIASILDHQILNNLL
ncbi:hypothetical protein [Bacillus cereus]|uniref:DUF2726 domain-containing protein n=1 Tax=Bacillus cereus (strain VD146) TaxID=1053236 RepID=R8MEJ3_BACCX|nr:hypothetical protein [Bacillus cereus]EOP32810.1 hypothetical protein IK1_05983 [Bacillus cereus VD146]